RDLPTAPDGSLWLAFARDTTARSITTAALPDLKHAIVYIGTPAKTVATPFGAMSEANLHAEAMEDMLLGHVLRRPAGAAKAELACLLLIGMATIFLLLRLNVWWAGAFTVLAIAGAGAISWHLFTVNHVLFDALGP